MTALRFYTDDGLHEWEYLQHYHSSVPVVLRWGIESLIPFCHYYETTGEAIDDVIVEYLDGHDLVLDDTGDFEIETDGIYDWVIYNGDAVQSGAADLDAGLARIRIDLDGGTTFWSDYFELCELDITVDCGKDGYDNYFNLYFSAEHDFGEPYNIIYQTGYENHLIFDTLPVRPDSIINVEGETDEAQDEFITYQSQRKIYHVEIIGGESLFDALRAIAMHEYIYVKWPCEDLRQAFNIEFDYDWVEDFLCRMTLSFSLGHAENNMCLEKSMCDINRNYEPDIEESEAFIMEIQIGGASLSFTLPLDGASAYDYIINWGDGTIEHFTTNSDQTHTYPRYGHYTIRITGTFPHIFFNNGASAWQVLRVLNLGDVGWTSFDNAFSGCSALTSISGSSDLSNVTTLSYACNECINLIEINTSDWNITNVLTNCEGTFKGCSSLITLNMNGWDVSNVVTFYYFCYGCTLLETISTTGWDTSSVLNFSRMFQNASSLKTSFAAFDVTAVVNIVTGLNFMLEGCDINTTGTTANYDATLVSWAAQAINANLVFHAGTSKYSAGGGGQAARAVLTGAPNNWTITDGGM